MVAPDGIVNDVDAFAARETFDLRGEILPRVDDRFVRAGFLRDGGLCVGAHGAVDSRAEHLRHLHDQAPGAARGRMHQHFIARLHRIRGMRQVVRGHALQHRRGRGLQIDAIGQRDQLRRRARARIRSRIREPSRKPRGRPV